MPIDVATIGTAAAMAGTQFAIDTASGAVKGRRGYKYSNKLADRQQERNKELTDYNMEKQKEMWEYTSYPNQKEQMKEAGLNPALMYGMGGGGGQSSNVSAASGGAPSMADTSSDSQGVVGMGIKSGMEMQLMKAQKDNIEADTANKRSQVPVNEVKVPNINKDTELKGAQEQSIGLDNALKALINSTTKDGKDVSTGDKTVGANAVGFKLLSTKVEEIQQGIKLMQEQGATQEQMQVKIQNETKLLQNEIDWQALDISGDNVGSAIEKIVKILVGVTTGAKGLKGISKKK